jgi:hypothetical protein
LDILEPSNLHVSNELKSELNLDNIPFISNDQLLATLSSTGAPDDQVVEAVRINTEARLLALKVSFFSIAGIALLAFFPAGWLPAQVRAPSAERKNASARREATPVPLGAGTPRLTDP